MDWKNLKEKALKLKDDGLKYSKIAMEKTKEYSSIAADKTGEALATTPLSLKIMADFEKIKNEKILAILFVNKNDDISKKILLTMPLILKDAWVNSATFRTCDIVDSPELTQEFQITKIPSLLVYQNGNQVKKTDNMDEIKKYLKDFVT